MPHMSQYVCRCAQVAYPRDNKRILLSAPPHLTTLDCRCVIVRDGQVIGSGYNMTNHTRNVSYQATQQALQPLAQDAAGQHHSPGSSSSTCGHFHSCCCSSTL